MAGGGGGEAGGCYRGEFYLMCHENGVSKNSPPGQGRATSKNAVLLLWILTLPYSRRWNSPL